MDGPTGVCGVRDEVRACAGAEVLCVELQDAVDLGGSVRASSECGGGTRWIEGLEVSVGNKRAMEEDDERIVH